MAMIEKVLQYGSAPKLSAVEKRVKRIAVPAPNLRFIFINLGTPFGEQK
jgi:hypothetical protein